LSFSRFPFIAEPDSKERDCINEAAVGQRNRRVIAHADLRAQLTAGSGKERSSSSNSSADRRTIQSML